MTISNDFVNIAVISDIHLGHKNTKTLSIIKNLEDLIFKDHSNKDLDILFLAGDVFDGLLELNDEDITYIDFFIEALLRYCYKNEIALRILEGTPSHDWTQSIRFITIAQMLELKDLDIKYIDNIHIEINEKFNMSILYVPDEIQPTTDKTLKLVKQAIYDAGLDQVDIAIMHGQFEYQLPAGIKNIPRHSSEEYLKIVKKLIAIGHVHTHSYLDRIVAQGSFDRLKHGEEEPKGYIKAKIYKDSFTFDFIENKNAQIYKTIEISDLSLEDTFRCLDEVTNTYPNSFIRLKATYNHPIFANMGEVVAKYPGITFSRLIKDKSANIDEQYSDLEIDTSEYTPITLTKDNIPDLLKPKLIIRFDNDERLLNKSLNLLEECL